MALDIVILGLPGAGKGTQAKRISAETGIPHIATGDMLREAMDSETEMGVRIKPTYDAGDLVPDDLMIELIRERLSAPDTSDGFILDGFPRTAGQAVALDELLGAGGLDRVVVFEVDEEELVQRMLARGRADDTEETIRHRFKVYLDQTQPLLDLYDSRGLTIRVDGVGGVEEVTERILAALDPQ